MCIILQFLKFIPKKSELLEIRYKLPLGLGLTYIKEEIKVNIS